MGRRLGCKVQVLGKSAGTRGVVGGDNDTHYEYLDLPAAKSWDALL